MIYDSLLETIGRTPVVLLKKENGNAIYVKLEGANPAGSVKDRVAFEMMGELREKGLLKPGAKCVEGTSGNTGIGLAFVCACMGVPLVIVMPEGMSRERIELMKAYGAEVLLTPKEKGMAGAEMKAAEMGRNGYVFLNQFENPANPKAHYLTTAEEILEDFPKGPDFLVAGVGTGGTIAGIAMKLKEKGCHTRIVAVEPEESEVLEGKKAGPHGIQGIGANFVPPLYRSDLVNEIVPVATADALKKAGALAKRGWFLGISSAAAVLASEKIGERTKGKTILAIAPDGGMKYMSTGIYGK
ncbi:MAG: cysteine synthase family protein [Bacilli bacterium]|jgi:cysteine synthase A|nr:cysteine synthase family protein [Bacilli bacterium]